MGPFSVSIAREGFSSGEPVVSLTVEPRNGAEGRGTIQEYEGAFVDLGRGAAVHVLARWRGARPGPTESTGYALKINI